MNETEHELLTNYAGFHCACGGWRIGSWNGARQSFEAHVERATGSTLPREATSERE